MNRRRQRAKLVRRADVWCAVSIGLLVVLLSSCGLRREPGVRLRAAPVAAAGARDPGLVEGDVFRRVNDFRRSRGLGALVLDRAMGDQAREHARWMASRGKISHRGAGGRFNKLQRAGLVSLAENVAYNYGHAEPAQTAVQGWLRSPGHYRNMTAPADQVTGVGAARARDGSWYFTQLYGCRR